LAPDPLSATGLAALAIKTSERAAAERGVGEVARRAEKLTRALAGGFKIESQEITIRCPEQIETVSIAFEPHAGILGQKVRFPYGKPQRVHLRPLLGVSELDQDAVVTNDSGFELSTRGLGTQLYLLDVEYEIQHPRLLEALVQKNTPVETPKTNSSEYWLHAELKHPSALKTRYQRFDLQDLEFAVDVGVAENVKTVIPKPLVKELEAAVALLEERNPFRKRVLGEQHLAAMESRGQESTMKLLGNLQSAFVPNTFRNYLEVKRDFHYGDCERGISLYDTLPIPTWPRSMKVVSRTDLSINRPAAQGTLVYKKDEFQRKVEQLLTVT
jgi:hypothetical protein